VQRTAAFHHHIADAGLPHAERLFEHTAACDTAVDMLNADAPPSQLPVPRFLGPAQLVPTRLLRGLEDVHAVQRECVKARILQPLTPRRQRRGGGSGAAFVMDTTRMRLAQEEDGPGFLDQEQVVQHVPLLLAAITRLLFSRVVGAREGALGAVMTTRGATGGGALCPASAGAMSRDEAGTATPRRACTAATLREGASPLVRRGVRNTGRKP